MNIFNGLVDGFLPNICGGVGGGWPNICSGSSFLSILNFSEWGVGPFKRKEWVGMIYVEKTLIQLELKYGYLPCKAVWKHLIIGKAKAVLK